MKMPMGLALTLMYYQCPWWLHWQKYAPWVWLLHQCFTNVTPMKLVLTLECELWQGQLSWLLHRCVANVPLVQLGPSPCITNTVGSYTGHGITESPMHLVSTLVYSQCTTSVIGSYTVHGIMELPMHLAYTLMYSQCMVHITTSHPGASPSGTVFLACFPQVVCVGMVLSGLDACLLVIPQRNSGQEGMRKRGRILGMKDEMLGI
jgi:hypothetical protein